MKFDRKMKLGIVIDNPLLGEVVLDVFKSNTFSNIWLESDFRRALSYLSKNEIQPTQFLIISLDKNGNMEDFLHKIRKLDSYVKIPILIVHNFTVQPLIDQLVDNGITHGLMYPFDDQCFQESMSELHGKFLLKVPFRF